MLNAIECVLCVTYLKRSFFIISLTTVLCISKCKDGHQSSRHIESLSLLCPPILLTSPSDFKKKIIITKYKLLLAHAHVSVSFSRVSVYLRLFVVAEGLLDCICLTCHLILSQSTTKQFVFVSVLSGTISHPQ